MPNVNPPKAEKKLHEIISKIGKKRTDFYYWLKERENPAVVDYLKAENNYLDTMLGHTKPLQEKLFEEMKARIKEDDASVPYQMDNYFYYTRYVAGGEYAIYCRKNNSLTAAEEIMVDGNELGKGKSFLSFGVKVSPNHQLACVNMDTVGRNFYTVRIKNLQNGEWLGDVIPSTRGNIEWANDNKSFFYSVPDPETLRESKVMMHTLGNPASSDKLIYEEKDSTLACSVEKSKSKKYIFINSSRTDANFIQIINADNLDKPKLFRPLEKNVDYSVDHIGDGKFYVYTNLKAKNYRLAACPEDNRQTAPSGQTDWSEKNWKDVIPEKENVLLRSVDYFKNYLVTDEVSEGLARIKIISWKNIFPPDPYKKSASVETQNVASLQGEYEISFDEPAYAAYLGYTPDLNSQTLRYNYTSLITPNSTYDINMSTHEKKLMKQQEVPGGYDKTKYTVERHMVTARDGKKIPLSLVYHKDKFKKDGANAGWINGYGSYGSSRDASFGSARISLLDRGFVFAIAHIRGGKEMGGQWYEDGKMLHKKNTFYDFIDCSDWLIQNNYVGKEKLFANGGSAGGLLMGAITNMRPELYRGIIAAVPFVDVMTTMEDESIPLTSFEWNEWGNPFIPEQYDYMLSYSPYDNVEKKNYPNLLVTTGLHDSQVQYWEPAKWVAKLREYKTDNHLLFLHTNMDAGHGGASGRFKSLKEVALTYAFALDILGIRD